MEKYRVTLTGQEIEILEEMIKKGKRSARILRNAYILLNCDESVAGKKKKDGEVAEFFGVTIGTVENIRKKFVMEGFETALYGRKSTRVHDPKIGGGAGAHLLALSCSAPPQGFARWSLRLLSEKMVALDYVDSISDETVRTVLKKRVEALEGKRLAHIAPKQQ